ncbi:hypothetical protein [Paenibacillus ihbetae]|uniref:Uncharacterized protein n=1 Tax=Paenibacillus ihbetae TaxID=1870820 RepID=A0A1B2DTY3_9BACL|nr:hypothetical protein [Paenibacillus ihbetae]ANY71172.1 hypothetical protein BBD41_00410 [Paenibacillus ihbetae]OOC61457.1 hypothetical protein BBD40_05915 [Paenibacillus ihbetae]
MEKMLRLELLLANLERHQTKEHVKNAVKEWLLASRSVIDSVIDTIEEEREAPVARKINITDE